MLRWFDRRCGAGMVVVAAIAMAIVLATSSAPLPERADPTAPFAHDPAAADAMLELVDLGAAGRWQADFLVEHDTGVADARSESTEINVDDVRVVDAGTTLTVIWAGNQANCTEVGEELQCLQVEGGPLLPEAEVLRVAIGAGGYAVAHAPERTVAGQRAQCFRFRKLMAGPLPGYGDRSEHCFAADGVPLLSRVERLGASDRRAATSVRRDVGPDDVDALLAPYGVSFATLPR